MKVLNNYETWGRCRQEIDNYNASGARHRLSASIGYQKEEDYEHIDLNQMLEQADKEMYIHKKKKKASR